MANQIVRSVRFVSSNHHRRFVPRAAFPFSQSIRTAYGCKLGSHTWRAASLYLVLLFFSEASVAETGNLSGSSLTGLINS